MTISAHAQPRTPVSFTAVKLDDLFWTPRIRVNRENTLPFAYQLCKETGRIDAFRLNWRPGSEPVPHIFWDSDVAKWLEAACYSIATHPDATLEVCIDEVIALIISAQQPDGYLNVHFTVVEPEKRWTNLRDWHELYCAGHLMEAAVAHYHATGKRHFLETMCRYADYIATVFGSKPGQKRGYCGHEEIELALVKLFQATGEERYLRLSEYFVNERGQQPHYFDEEARERNEAPRDFWAGTYEYCQAHRPVREQSKVTGHAVRAMYLYSAMADLAAVTGDDGLRAACERIWDDLCATKLYLTGGIGPSRQNEGFTVNYDLPNQTAYAETCAAIGMVFWNHRMLQLTGDGKYADVLEQALYNGVLSGVSQDGIRFFYENPLASVGLHHRQRWFSCSCCPTNIMRLLPALGGYIYSQTADGLSIDLYAQGEMDTTLADGTRVSLAQQTDYPWDGRVGVTVTPAREVSWTLRLRVPAWCRAFTLSVNGVRQQLPVVAGYLALNRTWCAGDAVVLDLDMPIERLEAHPAIAEDRGHVALQRGALVYCLEDVDHADASVQQIALPDSATLTARFAADLLGGVVVIEGEATMIDGSGWGKTLYRPAQDAQSVGTPVAIRAIPYFAWDNRTPGGMVVWISRA